MTQRIYLVVLFFVILFSSELGFAQSSKKEYKKQLKDEEKGYVTREVNDKLFVTNNDEFYFEFNNVNKVPFYFDRGGRDKINDLEKKLNDAQSEMMKSKYEKELIREIEMYVSKFGIDNFHRDTDLLWELAQLYEKNEMLLQAKAAYRLVLKHHRREVVQEIQQYFKIREHYDDLTQLEKDYYVPLEYYYELVEYRRAIDTLLPPKSVLLNMGELINKKGVRDYAASINASDILMVYTRRKLDKRYVGGKPLYYENLFYSQGYDDGFWDVAVEFPEPINTRCNEGSACISRDGTTLYFTKCPSAGGQFDCVDIYGECDLFYSKMQSDSTWSEPKNLGATVNSVFWDSHPSLSPTEDTLYFASNRKGGFGLSDIYFTYKNSKGEWTAAQNLGPIVNTRNNEYSPFLDKTHNVLYFSSNGHVLNFDDLDHKKTYVTEDIYKSYRRGRFWTEPKNVGPLVNGTGTEIYFSIDSKAKNLYYSKTEEGSKDNLITDLFSFPVPMGAQPTATVSLKGTLVDEETGDPYEGIVSVIDLENGIEVAPKSVRADGSYEFDLIDHNDYLLIIQGDEFFRIEKLFTLDGDTTIHSEAQSIKNRKLQFTSIVFENGKSNILEEMEDDLWDVINFLVDNPKFYLTIGGHTDHDGNSEANKRLSQARADAIKRFIVDNGMIPEKRIEAIGWGDTKPIKEKEETESDKQINRRVEFEIIHEQFWEDRNTGTGE